MADLSQYADDMAYLAAQARTGSLTSNNAIYQKLKERAKWLPDLNRWLAREIDPKVRYI